MNITIFGATGRVGQEILKHALVDGHQVKALVRSLKLEDHDHLEVMTGDVRNQEDIERAIQGADLVFSALGTDRTTTLSEAVPFIKEAMEKQGIKRLITIGTAGILNSRMTPGVLRYQGGDSNRKLTFAAEEHEKVYRLLKASELDWTIVCPTYLPDGEASGSYRTEKDFLPEEGREITVGDTADFAYKQMESAEFSKSRVGISY
ncbi:NAD(P)-dependent oxidoreductase [Planococcus ruber]|uniref:NAD(P)-dependent oxidoreductase n=1 Tax=Planococcus ruber TaxID=2027871 RepID=UPI001FEED081|nr:SDR family oxidoreductase [Planococcus ruber]MCJ1909523.1 SDR family oxidoreductase [Planococcus ruber]